MKSSYQLFEQSKLRNETKTLELKFFSICS